MNKNLLMATALAGSLAVAPFLWGSAQATPASTAQVTNNGLLTLIAEQGGGGNASGGGGASGASGHANGGGPETIREELDALPEVYERRLWEEKVERTYQFVFEHYEGMAAAAELRVW